MKNGKNNLKGGFAGLLLNINRYATAVVCNADNIILFYDNINSVTKACKCLINRVIHYLVDKVVQT